MPIFTLRLLEDGERADRTTLEAIVRDGGGTLTWHIDEALRLAYGTCSGVDSAAVVGQNVTVYEGDIIAVALTPSCVEAIPRLLDALGGAGRPLGVMAAFERAQNVVVEIAWQRTLPSFVLGIADRELRAMGATRRTRLLTALSDAAACAIAADGLATPDIAPSRVLEALLESRDAVH